jgi:hypothetical protein
MLFLEKWQQALGARPLARSESLWDRWSDGPGLGAAINPGGQNGAAPIEAEFAESTSESNTIINYYIILITY